MNLWVYSERRSFDLLIDTVTTSETPHLHSRLALCEERSRRCEVRAVNGFNIIASRHRVVEDLSEMLGHVNLSIGEVS